MGPRRSRRQPCTSRTQTTTIRTAPHEEHYPELPRTSHRVHTDFEDWNSEGSDTFVTISFGTSARSMSTLSTPRMRPCSTGTRSPTPWLTREADLERRVLHLARHLLELLRHHHRHTFACLSLLARCWGHTDLSRRVFHARSRFVAVRCSSAAEPANACPWGDRRCARRSFFAGGTDSAEGQRFSALLGREHPRLRQAARAHRAALSSSVSTKGGLGFSPVYDERS